ncbi:hypothetical protein R3P38DRAFT_3102320 [Favolaschia claudopus]|uniref:Uncharacterized protein n=1 Tax=Favolaschia claudopus TaxID=2862362 RepID=A0AAV9ZL79_9AGAR
MKVEELVQQIDAKGRVLLESLGSVTRAEIQDVEFATWQEFESQHAESLSFRTQYFHPERIIIVTHASPTHPSFMTLLRPIVDFTRAVNDSDSDQQFAVTTNETIKLVSKTSIIPDLGFGKRVLGHRASQWFVTFECAWNQSATTDLLAKVKKSFETPHLSAVVCLVIDEKQYKAPLTTVAKPEGEMPACFTPDVLAPRQPLSPILYVDHPWVRIKKLSIDIYLRENETPNCFDLLPGSTDLKNQQEQADRAVLRLLGQAIGRDLFLKTLEKTEKPFPFDWVEFYEELDHSLLGLAHERFSTWMGIEGVHPPVEVVKHPLEDFELETVIDDFCSEKQKH